ncbi:MAG: diguanylate cyclase [Erysipelotrichaceae bacterium]|nr:diguanylate cyclase [Erysipelotrichaceae bacterium]
MDKLRQIYNSFHFGGLNKEEIKLCLPEIRKRNAESLDGVLLILFCAIVMLTISSYIPGSGEEGNKYLYTVFTVIIGVEYLISQVLMAKAPDKMIILSYAMMVTTYAFGIWQAVFAGIDASSAAFCVFIVAAPMLVIDYPVRLAYLTIFMEIILLVSYFKVGNTLGDRFVVVNSLSCTFLGIFCSYKVQLTKFSDIRNHLMLKVQRDTDMMTGAYSRVAYIHDLGVMTDNSLASGIIYADVNGLKKANDTYGHEAGDRLIKTAFSLMLKYFNHTGDRIYRIGGDEFVIISVGITKEIFEIRFNKMMNDENHEVLSCGSVYLDEIKDAEIAIKQAEMEMYLQKEQYYKSHPEKERRVN